MSYKFDTEYITRVLEENNKVTENDAMLAYVRAHKNRGKNSLKSLAKKFGIGKEVKIDKEK